MARTGLATASYDTPQKGFRDYSPIQYIVIHHAASTSLEGVIALEMGARQVSSTLIIKDDHIVSMMDEQWRAWSLSSNYYDSISLSVETCNSGGAEEGWPISEASYKSLAKVVADWCTRYSIPCNRDRVIGHREVYSRFGASYATACPGGIDLDRVVADANRILTGGGQKTKGEQEMLLYAKTSTAPGKDPARRDANLLLALAGGAPGTDENWFEFNNGPNDLAAKYFAGRGVGAVFLSDTEWEGHKAVYRSKPSVSVGNVTVNGDPKVAELLTQNLAVNKALLAHLGG